MLASMLLVLGLACYMDLWIIVLQAMRNHIGVASTQAVKELTN